MGSDKTAVALLAMIATAACGQQAVLVAPTTVLAQQHYDSLSRLLEAAGAAAAADRGYQGEGQGEESGRGIKPVTQRIRRSYLKRGEGVKPGFTSVCALPLNCLSVALLSALFGQLHGFG